MQEFLFFKDLHYEKAKQNSNNIKSAVLYFWNKKGKKNERC